jgi:hypothetical protein
LIKNKLSNTVAIMAKKDSGADIVGLKFNSLLVEEELDRRSGHRFFRCVCDCGKEKITSYQHLVRGDTKNCGDHRSEDLTGRTFGQLTVLERIKVNRGHNWRCKCSCGKIHEVRGSSLLNGGTVSCGCKRRKPEGEGQFNKYFARYQREAKKRNLEWKLSEKEFRKITSSNCVYCGEPPKSQPYGGFNGMYPKNGIDRVNNSKGYIKGNVVPCCPMCNWMKAGYTKKEFLAHIKQIAKEQKL